MKWQILMIAFLWPFFLSASNESDFLKKERKGQSAGFIENKGQIIDQKNKYNPGVLYLLNMPGFNVQLRKDGFSYDVYSIIHPNTGAGECPDPSPEDIDSVSFSFHRIDFDFLDHNKPDIAAEGKSVDYTNYYTAGTSDHGILKVHGYRRITYKNLYDKIDLVCEFNEKTLFKYNFIVHRGGDLNAIKFRISGASSQVDERGSILLNNRFGNITEEIPASYVVSTGRRSEVTIKFRPAGENSYQFSYKGPSDFDSLVVDPIPTRDWGTYFGGGVNDYLAELCLDDQFLYFNGTTLSSAVIATAGAFQGTLAGTQDAFIQKFKSDGTRVWGTYFGGENIDWGNGLGLDDAGHLALTGSTTSLTGIATVGSHQPLYGGGNDDGFIALFDTSGQRLWSTYYGGSSGDNISRCEFDGQGNLYFVGYSQSSNSISTTGCHQFMYGGGWIDGVFAKFAMDGTRIWGTYCGGNFQDQLTEVAIDQQGMIVIAGETNSSNNIASPGAYQGNLGNPAAFNGDHDTFLCRFDPSGVRLWGTYYGGTGNDSDVGLGISADGAILLSGSTYSTDVMSSPGAYQSSISGLQDAFYAKFDITGNRLYGTYFGGPMYEWTTNITTDEASNVYLSGSTSSDEGIATSDGFLTTNAATGFWPNAFLVRFNASNQRVWGTYYGDSISTWSYRTIVRVDTIYMAGSTNDIKGIATPGAFQSSMLGSASGFVVRLNDCYAPDSLDQITGPETFCYSSSGIIFSVAPVANTTGYVWTVPAGATIAAGQNTNVITVDFGTVITPGVITVYARNNCGRTNTVQLPVAPKPAPVPVISGSSIACEGDLITYTTDPGKSIYSWTVSPGGTITGGGTITDNFADVTWNLPGSLGVSVNYTDINGCAASQPTNLNVTVFPGDSVKVSIAASAYSICAGTSVTFTATPTGSGTLSYQWNVNGISQPGNSNIFNYTPANNDVVACVLTSSQTVCISNNPATSNTIAMVVNQFDSVSISVAPSLNPVCAGTAVNFTAVPVNGGSTPQYQWKVNGLIAGTNSPNYSYLPVNGDVITCALTSNALCPSGNPAQSNLVTMVVNANLPAGITISASPNPFCPGSAVNFTATPVNGGSNPTYQWKVNGIIAGTNSSGFSYVAANNDSVRCVMTSNLSCVSGNPVSSAKIVMIVSPSPFVTFTPCFDTITTLTAKPFKLKGGLPLEGIWSGPGVNASTGFFNPAQAGVGTHALMYTYTNVYGCEASAKCNVQCANISAFTCGGTLTDIRDNKTYPTVQIGSQCWMQKNLEYGIVISENIPQTDNCVPEKYSSLVTIVTNVTTVTTVTTVTNHTLYQWDELMQYQTAEGAQGLCPPGWHVPTETEWSMLFNFYNGKSRAGKPLQDTLVNGFQTLMSGVLYSQNFQKFGDFGTMFWSSNASGTERAMAHGMNVWNYSVSDYAAGRGNALAVRCLRDQDKKHQIDHCAL